MTNVVRAKNINNNGPYLLRNDKKAIADSNTKTVDDTTVNTNDERFLKYSRAITEAKNKQYSSAICQHFRFAYSVLIPYGITRYMLSVK